MAFARIEQNMVISSWTDSASSSLSRLDVNQHIEVPSNGCYKDRKWIEIDKDKAEEVANRFLILVDKMDGIMPILYGECVE